MLWVSNVGRQIMREESRNPGKGNASMQAVKNKGRKEKKGKYNYKYKN